MQKTVLVTGGAGYIGAVLTEKLMGRGHNLRVFDRFYFGKAPLTHLGTSLELIEGDIRRTPEGLFDGVDAVIHLAALSNDPTAEFNPTMNYEFNTKATAALARRAKSARVKRFLYASSCSIYDTGDGGNRIKDENTRVNPTRAYSVSKYRAEQELLRIADTRFCVVILRKGTVYGFSPRMRYDLIVNAMLKSALEDGVIEVFCGGNQWRPLVDVEDTAEAYDQALSAPAAKINAEVINIANDNFRVIKVAQKIQRTLKERFEMNVPIVQRKRNAVDRSYRVSTNKARKLLKFNPHLSIEDSVVKMIRTIRKNGFTDFANPIYHNIRWMEPILKRESERRGTRR